jgi:pilus assembly protein CpaE
MIAAIISPRRSVSLELQTILENTLGLEAVWMVYDYPDRQGLARLNDARSGCVVFLDSENVAEAARVGADLDTNYPWVGLVGISSLESPERLLSLMKVGVREVISQPFDRAEVIETLAKAARKLRPAAVPREATGDIIAFTPAKPGAGATTLAVSVAAALPRVSGHRTLLADFDLSLGMTSFLLKLDGQSNVSDMLEQSQWLDEDLWWRLVQQCGPLDVLGSSPTEFKRSWDPSDFLAVLRFAQGLYPFTCVDLPGNMDAYEIEILRQARQVFLVCAPDIGCLHVARRKSELMARLGLLDNVSLVLNRNEKRNSLSMQDIETVVQLPVRYTLPNDERTVSQSAARGLAIGPETPLGEQLEALARHLTKPGAAAPPVSKARRFVEYFSTASVRAIPAWRGR